MRPQGGDAVTSEGAALKMSMGEDEDSLAREQCRVARAGLGMGVHELADLAGLASSTVVGFEAGQTRGSAETRRAIKRVLEQAGAIFHCEGGQGAAVSFKSDRKAVRGHRRHAARQGSPPFESRGR